jgi:glycine/D-amino acid oxidase-like deaminating enzyme
MGGTGTLTAAMFQTKLALYTSYVLGAKLPRGSLPEALFWDTNDPYTYLRVDEHGDNQYAIFGGEDVKTGQEKDAEGVFRSLERRLLESIPLAKVQHRRMGQVIETADGLPYIGANSDTQFVATGFAGNGLTLGTVGAMMARDWCLGRENPWSDLFRVDRKPFHGGTWQYLKENFDYPYYLLRDRLSRADEGNVEDLARGEGRILNWNKQKVAAYRMNTAR